MSLVRVVQVGVGTVKSMTKNKIEIMNKDNGMNLVDQPGQLALMFGEMELVALNMSKNKNFSCLSGLSSLTGLCLFPGSE